MKKISLVLFSVLLVSMAFATPISNPTQQSTSVAAPPQFIPFKVWVVPYNMNGKRIAGHYEHFNFIITGTEKVVLDAPQFNPSLPSMPNLPAMVTPE